MLETIKSLSKFLYCASQIKQTLAEKKQKNKSFVNFGYFEKYYF